MKDLLSLTAGALALVDAISGTRLADELAERVVLVGDRRAKAHKTTPLTARDVARLIAAQERRERRAG